MAQDDIQGQVVDGSGNPVSGAIVELTRSYQSSPPSEEVVRRTTTDANGNYLFEAHPDGDGTTQEWHVAAYNYDGSAYVNSFNNPGVTADLPADAIPDSGMFQSPLYQYTAIAGLNASDGQTADNWTEQLAGAGDATTVGGPVYRGDQAGFKAVEYDGGDDAHNWPSDGQLPTGSSSVSFAATVYVKSTHTGTVAIYGNGAAKGASIELRLNSDNTVRCLTGFLTADAQGGSYPIGSWITIGGSLSPSQADVHLNGSNVDTDSNVGTVNLQDNDRGIGYRAYNNDNFADIYLHDLVISDTKEPDQAFSDYHSKRLG